MNISNEQIFSITTTHLEEIEPRFELEDLSDDWQETLASVESVSSTTELHNRVCMRIRNRFCEPDFYEKYKDLYDAVSKDIFKKIEFILLQEIMQSALARFLREFNTNNGCMALWTATHIKEWNNPRTHPQYPSGQNIAKFLRTHVGWDDKSLSIFLGPENASLIKENPYSSTETKARISLKAYIFSLEPGTPWTSTKLQNEWRTKGFVTGRTILDRIWSIHHTCTEKEIRDVLGPEADELLIRNPFHLDWHKWNLEEVKSVLDLFFQTLAPGQCWSPRILRDWGTSDHPHLGRSISNWLEANYRCPINPDKVDWLYITIEIIGLETINNNPFTFKGKDFFGGYDAQENANSYTNHTEREPSFNNLSQVITQEEQTHHLRLEILHTNLQHEIERLSPDAKERVQNFIADPDCLIEEIGDVIETLRSRMTHLEHVAF